MQEAEVISAGLHVDHRTHIGTQSTDNCARHEVQMYLGRINAKVKGLQSQAIRSHSSAFPMATHAPMYTGGGGVGWGHKAREEDLALLGLSWCERGESSYMAQTERSLG